MNNSALNQCNEVFKVKKILLLDESLQRYTRDLLQHIAYDQLPAFDFCTTNNTDYCNSISLLFWYFVRNPALIFVIFCRWRMYTHKQINFTWFLVISMLWDFASWVDVSLPGMTYLLYGIKVRQYEKEDRFWIRNFY